MVKNDELYHYASPYYDPVKAHEYYMEHRELKGRSTSGMSDTQREGWTYAQKQIKTAKEKEKDSEKTATEQNIAKMRAKAEATRVEIAARVAEKVKRINARLKQEQSQWDTSKISDKLSSNVRSKQVAYYQVQKAKASAIAASDKNRVSSSAAEEKEKLSSDLSTAISNVRAEYKKKLADINTKYEKIYDEEYAGIKANLPGKSTPSGNSKKTASKKSSSSSSKKSKKSSSSSSKKSKSLEDYIIDWNKWNSKNKKK